MSFGSAVAEVMEPRTSADGSNRRVYPTNVYAEFVVSEVDQSIAARFEKQVVRHGRRLAVKTARHSLTYDALNKLANRLARAIQNRTQGEPTAVAILLEHDAPLVAAILGVLKAGKFYVALEPSHPEERLRNLLTDCEAGLLITESKHVSRAQEIAPGTCEVLNIDALELGLAEENLELEISPAALAYLIYTSGSTGKPKGVCQTQRNVLHHTRKYTNACHLCAEDRFSLLALCSFSASVSNLFGALLNGAALLPFKVKEEGVVSLLVWLRREKISIYHSVPLVFRNLAKAVTDSASLPELRLIKLGGEPITRGDVDLYKQHFAQHALLYIGLGSSELNCIRYWLLDRWSDFQGPIAPVGFAVEETEVLLLDQDLAEVAESEAGEIAIRSPNLFPGYWRRPDLTAAAFISDPDGTIARVFRTGDLGRMLPGGLLQHLGRVEQQIKIRGGRIQPAEVEFALRDLPGVDNCAVVVREDCEESQLVAYLTNGKGVKPDASTLRSRLSQKLPEYMVPSRFVWMDQLPLTNGKIDRRALAERKELSPNDSNNYLGPRNELEHQLVSIWRKILRLERIGIRDNFIELGGYSLTAAQVAVEIEQSLGHKLPIAALFRCPTIESLSDYLEQGESAPPLSSLVPLHPAGTKPPLFIVHGWGGDVFFYHDLAKLFQDRPSFGLQAVGLDGKVPRHISVEQMAAHYVREICAAQPEGPYHLVGYSLGSLIAFEIGRQLYQLGRRVEFLGLLDPPIRPAPWSVYARTIAPLLWRSARFHLGRWFQTFGRESVHLKRRWKRLRRWIDRNRPRPPLLFVAPENSVAAPEVPGFRDYYSAVASSYRLRRYPGRIDLVISDSLPKILLPLWGGLAKGGAKVHRASCTHRQMIEQEHLPALAKILEQAIDHPAR